MTPNHGRQHREPKSVLTFSPTLTYSYFWECRTLSHSSFELTRREGLWLGALHPCRISLRFPKRIIFTAIISPRALVIQYEPSSVFIFFTLILRSRYSALTQVNPRTLYTNCQWEDKLPCKRKWFVTLTLHPDGSSPPKAPFPLIQSSQTRPIYRHDFKPINAPGISYPLLVFTDRTLDNDNRSVSALTH